jgi:uncharacterized protein (DUF1501 family)
MMLTLSRRSTLLGLPTVFSSLWGRLAFGAADTDRRFIVVILRGALDGLSAVMPYGDRDFQELRGGLTLPPPGQPEGLLDLGGFHGLHPSLPSLHRMYKGGEVAILHAVAGPYRERSHFKAQDMLESGADHRLADGWLNRAVAAVPRAAAPASGRAPIAISVTVPLILRGKVQVENWAPSNLTAPQVDLYTTIAALNAADPVTGPALRMGMEARGFSKEVLAGAKGHGSDFASLAQSAGKFLAAADGPRVAAMEIGGWDTHAAQVSRLNATLLRLDEGLLALRTALGPVWKNTAVLVLTEFGRTARINGTGGTDHGTGSVAFVLGGAVKGGRIIADWPGLAQGKLFENRDLMPTLDLRAITKALVADHLGVGPAALGTVFPGSDGVAPIRGLLRA